MCLKRKKEKLTHHFITYLQMAKLMERKNTKYFFNLGKQNGFENWCQVKVGLMIKMLMTANLPDWLSLVP